MMQRVREIWSILGAVKMRRLVPNQGRKKNPGAHPGLHSSALRVSTAYSKARIGGRTLSRARGGNAPRAMYLLKSTGLTPVEQEKIGTGECGRGLGVIVKNALHHDPCDRLMFRAAVKSKGCGKSGLFFPASARSCVLDE